MTPPVERTTDDRRTALSDLRLDVRYAVRTLRRTPGFTLVALVTLALGIGATTAMFSVLDHALGQSLPFPEAQRLVLGRPTFNGRVGSWVAFPDYLDYREGSQTIGSLATIGAGSSLATITGRGEPEQARLTHATGNLFTTLGVVPHLGRFSNLDELPEGGGGEVVVSHEFWHRWFDGSREALGRSLTVNGNPLTVVGVLPPGFHFFYDADLWVPTWAGQRNPINRRYHNWILVGRLAPGASRDTAQAEVDVISAQLAEAYPDSNRNKGLHLDGLHAAMVGGYSQPLLVLTAAIVLVLLIACGNVASLLLARGSTRTSELAVRTALGATRSRLARLLLMECLILALAAGCLGIVLAVWIQDMILTFVSMDRLGIGEVGLSPSMLGIALVLSLSTVLLFGVFPSRAATRADPAENLKKGSGRTTSGGGIRYRSGLVVLQAALSVILLAGSGLLIRSFVALRAVDPGFRVKNLLTATVALPAAEYPEDNLRILFFQSLREQIEALPGVEAVAIIDRLPILQRAGDVAIWDPERPPETNREALFADRRVAMAGFFETMEIPVLEGRVLEPGDTARSHRVVVLNRAAAEALFPERSAVGRQVAADVSFLGWEEPTVFEVVGVVEDYTLSSLGGAPREAMFFPFAQQPPRTMRIAVATASDASNLIRPIQEEVWKLDRNIVLSNSQTMAEVISGSLANTRSVTTVLGLFTAVALGLAALGLHGVLAFLVGQRAREIGIRVALGASRAKVLGMVLTWGMMLVGLGVIFGTVGALGATRIVEGMLFQISATDPASLAGAAGLFLLIALAACLLPAWRASNINPLEALRVE